MVTETKLIRVREGIPNPVKEMIVAKRASFDAAHYLPKYEGKCKNLHGHHWVVELAVKGPVQESGMVVDFTLLKEFLDSIVEKFDHHLLNDLIQNPTAENICLWIEKNWKVWYLEGCELAWIKVWETEDSFALLSY